MTLIERIFQTSDIVVNDRTSYYILSSAMAEMGELAEEVGIANGGSYKNAGPDGILGEALDTIACLVDLIHKEYPNITEQDLVAYMSVKLNKWESKVKEQQNDK